MSSAKPQKAERNSIIDRAINDAMWTAVIILLVTAVLSFVPADTVAYWGTMARSAPAPVPYWDLIEKNAANHDVDPYLLAAVIRQESNFNPEIDNVQGSGAAGLGQLMPITVQDCGISDPYDPDQNLWCAARILGQYTRRYDGDVELGLAAYNAGPVAIDACRCVPGDNTNGTGSTDSSTANYVRNVLSYRDEYAGGPRLAAQRIAINLPRLAEILRLPQVVLSYVAPAAPWQGNGARASVIPGCSRTPAPLRPETAPISPFRKASITQDLHGCSYSHAAVDLAAVGDKTLLAPITGEITASYTDGLGNPVLVITNRDYIVTILHDIYYVGVGDHVVRGQEIGVVASIGNSTGPHAHITIYDQRAEGNVDPLAVMAGDFTDLSSYR